MTAFAAWVTERMAFKVHSHLGVTVDDEVSLS